MPTSHPEAGSTRRRSLSDRPLSIVPNASGNATPEAELAALLVGTRARREAAEARIGALAGSVDQDLLARLLVRQRIFPLVGSRLTQRQPQTLTDGFRSRLHHATATARHRAMAFSALTAHVAQALEAADIRAVPLKG